MLNLHSVARGAVSALHPEETVALYQSTGQSNVLGRIVPTYAEAQTVQAQVQSLSSDELAHFEAASRTKISRKAYLFASESLPPAGIIRPLGRNGDVIRRADGSWWIVSAVLEDFTASGWVCVGVTMQTEAPAGLEGEA